jgi:glycosyltransferase involved in cell wall biosynthesis
VAELMKISVVVNNYNYARFLPEALDRALEQLAPDDEVVVVDDGSTDASADILARYVDEPSVRVFRQANQGQFGAMLDGMAAARGDLLLLLDSDDYYLDGYLERVRTLAREHPDIELFFSAPEPGGASAANRVVAMRRMLSRMELEPGPTGTTVWTTLLTGEFVGTPTSGVALRRRLAERILEVRAEVDDDLSVPPLIGRLLRLPRDSHIVRRLSGDGIVLRAAGAAGAMKFYDPRPAFFYRVHERNAYASINRLGRLYLRLARGAQIARQLRAAYGIPLPEVDEVIAEARRRSRPLNSKRRARLILNYCYCVLRVRGGLARKASALARIPRAVLTRTD